LRELCKQLGGFEPEIAALADSPDSLIGMVAAGRGVFVGPEVAIRGRQEPWRSAGDIYVLTEPGSIFELFAIWKKQSAARWLAAPLASCYRPTRRPLLVSPLSAPSQ